MSGEIALSEEPIGAQFASVRSLIGVHFARMEVKHALFGKCLRTLIHVALVFAVVVVSGGDMERKVARGAESPGTELAAEGALVGVQQHMAREVGARLCAHGTHPRLGAVHLLTVLVEVGLDKELLTAALTHKALVTVREQVVTQCHPRLKAAAAGGARIGTLLRVHGGMLTQTARLCEGGPAALAGEGSLPGVRAGVTPQRGVT